jgi:hypothetical protein
MIGDNGIWSLIPIYTKGVIRNRKAKTDKQYIDQMKKDKKTNKTLHRQVKIEPHESLKNVGVNFGANVLKLVRVDIWQVLHGLMRP